MAAIGNLRKIRLEKLKKIREFGIDPYPATSGRKQTIAQARKMMGKKVAVAGRIMAIRGHGGIQFFDLCDESGTIQLVLKKDNLSPIAYRLSQLLDIGDFIDASGKIFKTKAGETSVLVKNFHLLTKSIRPLPSKWHGLKDVEERYRRRYLDLIMNPKVKDAFLIRTEVLTELRNYLNSYGFVEVETPILQSIYGGAAAKPFVTHHNVLDFDLYLRISDELYLKRLIVGGFEKVYEVCKDFRNEGIGRQHNPEFTQLEFYWAYADYEDLMEFTEAMLTHVIKKVIGKLKIKHEKTVLDFTPPWRRVTFRDLLYKELGIDINIVDTEQRLAREIKKKKIKLDLKGIVGYGALVDKLYKETCRSKLVQPTLLLDYPAEMIALAKRKTEDPSKIASFQLLVKGFELIKAYNELNDPVDQKERWLEMEKLAEKGLEEHEALDEDYVRALEYGMPPTAGWGIGIDRLVTFLTNTHSLKDVIFFPTLRLESKDA